MTTLQSIPVTTITGAATSLGDYQDKVVLVVNVASKCGLTPQYEGLEKLHETLGSRGFEVLGFPCNQFGSLEPGDEAQIKSFCETNYGVSFPMFAKIEVNGEGQHPLYAQLNAVADGEGYTGDIRWNFEKFLVSPSGEIVGRFGPAVEPQDAAIVDAIKAQLPA